MTPQQKQTELLQHRSLLLATLDYLEQRFGEEFVTDGNNLVAEFYQQQRLQTEKYFKQRRLDRLHQRLASLTKGLQNQDALAFTRYIKEKTGYDIDIFEDLRKRVAVIIAQNEIRTQNEANDIGEMLQHFRETSEREEEVQKLKSLLIDYYKRENKSSRKTKEGYSEVVSSVREDGAERVMVRISTGPKPKHFEEYEATSPNGKRRLRVMQWSDGKRASTSVVVEFTTASGAVCVLSGICPDVNARWKSDFTIVIETKREYTVELQNKEVRSYDDVISIEYIES